MQEGQKVMWHSVNRVLHGVIKEKFYRKKDGALIGYIVQTEQGRNVIVHPKSIINAQATKQEPR